MLGPQGHGGGWGVVVVQAAAKHLHLPVPLSVPSTAVVLAHILVTSAVSLMLLAYVYRTCGTMSSDVCSSVFICM